MKEKDEFAPLPLGLTEDQANAEFDRLQARLAPLWTSIRSMNQDPQTIVVVPSMSVDSGVRAFASRRSKSGICSCCCCSASRAPGLIYVTSQAIHPDVIDYYLDLLPGVFAGPRPQAVVPGRRRSTVRRQPLSQKLLARPQLIEQIRVAHHRSRARAHRPVQHDRRRSATLAMKLGIPMYGADPKHVSPRHQERLPQDVLARRGSPIRLGVEDLTSPDEMVNAIVEMRRTKPAIKKVVAKLNEGVSGTGNANVDLSGLPALRRLRVKEPASLDRREGDEVRVREDDLRALHGEARGPRRHRRKS